jgi:hypothetical protein
MRRRTWLVCSVAFAVKCLVVRGAIAADAKAKSSPRSDTGPRGGLWMPLGPYAAEVVVWETEIEVLVYERNGAPMERQSVQGTARISRKNQRLPLGLTLTGRGHHLRAAADFAEIKAATIRLALQIGDQVYEGVVQWDRSQDRARLDDRTNDEWVTPEQNNF